MDRERKAGKGDSKKWDDADDIEDSEPYERFIIIGSWIGDEFRR